MKFLILFLLNATAWANAPAFESLKAFQGQWQVEQKGKALPLTMTYDLGSKGQILTEQFGKELAVIHSVDGNLEMTHYCNAGSQPRLRLKPQVRKDVFEFELISVANLKSPETPHVHKVVYKMINPNRLEAEWIWKKGSAEETEAYVLTRK